MSISLALSSWQVTQRDLTSVCVSTTFPSFAGAWQVSQLFASKGACRNFAISLGDVRLVRIVALQAVGRAEGLVLMSLLQIGILRIVAIHAKRRRRLGQMEAVLHRRFGAGLVGDVAGVAAHIESGVTAALLGHIQSGLVATEAEILFLAARNRLQELILVVAGVRIVAREAVANRGRMHRPLDVSRFLVRMAGDAKRSRRGGDQLDAGNVFIDPDLMAAQAAGGHGGMNGLAFRFVVVALQALGGIGVLVQRNRMNHGGGAHREQGDEGDENPRPEYRDGDRRGWRAACGTRCDVGAVSHDLRMKSVPRIRHRTKRRTLDSAHFFAPRLLRKLTDATVPSGLCATW